MHLCKHLRIALDRIGGGINGAEEVVAESFTLFFIVPKSGREVPPDLPAVDNRQKTSASPSFGEHLVSGYNVVGVTLVFGQTFVNYRAMGVAQWDRRWVCRKACPNDLG